MAIRRNVMVLLILAGVVGPVLPASADTLVRQAAPTRESYFSDGLLDGVGGWVYVEPEPAPGPAQLSPTTYVYEELFRFQADGSANRVGVVGLSADAGGPLVGIRVIDRTDPNGGPPAVTLRYAWSPGRIYFLLAYHLGGDWWGGWVYDLTANAWTFIGAVRAPAGWGRLDPMAAVTIYGAAGVPPAAPFDLEQTPFVNGTCASFPKADAWFYAPYGWRGTDIVTPLGFEEMGAGSVCPGRTGTANGWLHIGVGTAPTG